MRKKLWCLFFVLFFVGCVKSPKTFWYLKNVGADVQRTAQIQQTLDRCSEGLFSYFPKKPRKLKVFVYGSRDDFLAGLENELGFRKEAALFFKEAGAPRPWEDKFLIPPEMSSVNVCHELVHHYLESNTSRKHLLEAKWFDEGAANYLADIILDPHRISEKS